MTKKEVENFSTQNDDPTLKKNKKKSGCLKWVLIAIGIFILLSACTAFLTGDDSNENNKDSKKTETSFTPPPVTKEENNEVEKKEKTKEKETREDKDDQVPREHKNALRSAEQYNEIMPMSKAGLFQQLTSEAGDGFPEEAAQYAIDNLDANYKENALKSAKNYQEIMPMSDNELYNQLTSDAGEKYTPEEAQYAIDNLDEAPKEKETREDKDDAVPREYKNALRSAEQYNEMMPMSKAGLFQQLTSETGDGFPEEAAQYAIDNLDANYKENALKSAKNYQEIMPMSDNELYNQLTSDAGEKYTAEEAQYAIDNLEN